MIDLRSLPLLCGDHIRRLGEIYRSYLPDRDKQRAFEIGISDTSDCLNCLARRSGEYVPARTKVKICVVGEKSAEKAALLSPFVRPNFDEGYIQTLGSQVSRKQLIVANPSGSGEIQVEMTIWNIMGNSGFRELLKEAFFYGATGALCVSDGTRTDGLDSLDGWVSDLFDVTGRIPTVILVNRKGELRKKIIEESEVAAKAKAYDASYFYTSTETGENVETALQTLAERIVTDRLRKKGKVRHGYGDA